MSHRARILIFLAAGGLFALSASIPWGPDASVRRAAGLVLATLVLWIAEVAPLGVVAIGIPIAAVFAGLLAWKDAVVAWGDPVVFLFLGSFLLARALDKYGAFDWLLESRRLADRIGVKGTDRLGTLRLAALVLFISGAISSFQNNTAVTAMLLPVVVALARRCDAPAAVLLSLAMGATLGGMATPVGTAPNFIGFAAMKAVDRDFTFLSWLRVGVPVWVGMSVIAWGVLAIAARWAGRGTATATWIDPLVETDVGPEISSASASGGIADGQTPAANGLRRDDAHRAAGRRWAVGAFLVAATLWLVPGVVIAATPEDDWRREAVERYLPESLVPIALAWVLFLVRTGPQRRPVLDRHDFQALDWDTLFLIAGGLCLGRVLATSGAAKALAGAVAGAELSPVLLMLAMAGATVLLSELTSNTATASLMVPIAGSLADPLGLSPTHAIWLVALAASLGFALPVSTPPNALVYGTRLIPLRTMAAVGIAVDVLSIVWLVACMHFFA